MKKKGAIELSMTTIIVVVIGITLLVLGIKFVYDTFGGISEQQKGLREASDSMIKDLFGQSKDALKISPSTMSVEQGDSGQVQVIARNTGSSTASIGYSLEVKSSPEEVTLSDVEGWFVWDDSSYDLGSGKAVTDDVIIDVPDDAPLGSYKIVMMPCKGTSCDPAEKATLILKIE